MQNRILLLIIFFVCSTLLSSLSGQSTPRKSEHVILISFDGFRWDYPERGLTPNMQKLRENGVSATGLKPVFPTKTFPNHISIVTGLYPENHGIILNDFINPFTGEDYALGNREAVRNGNWYDCEFIWETAQKQGVKSASYFWPASSIVQEGRHPERFEVYDHDRPFETRVEGVLNWLSLPENERPQFITMYFHLSDSYGHDFGPDSPEVNFAIARQDSMLGLLMDGLAQQNLLDKTDLIVVSDHGMIETFKEKSIRIEEDLLSAEGCRFTSDGPIMMIQPKAGETDKVYKALKDNESHYKTYLRAEVPEHLHFSNHPFISDIVLIADPGWTLLHRASGDWLPGKGNHGYSPHFIKMHGIFYAAGPSFRSNFRTGTLQTIDLYPLLCAILNIYPVQNIDGKFERIGYILER